MHKIRIITAVNATSLEKGVNDWINDHRASVIVKSIQYIGAVHGTPNHIGAMITYTA